MGEDTGVDVGEDTGVDVGEDTGVDVGEDTGVDVGEDGELETNVGQLDMVNVELVSTPIPIIWFL